MLMRRMKQRMNAVLVQVEKFGQGGVEDEGKLFVNVILTGLKSVREATLTACEQKTGGRFTHFLDGRKDHPLILSCPASACIVGENPAL